ncbi:MAG TPA: hypothetical protein EYH53_03965 [Methanothermococcus okinawensis]|nr:hypothetical protein [Methanothermococcus okinawensis]
MKLWIFCKYDNPKNLGEDSFVINCGICRGIDTLNSIKIILEEYQDEIEEIVYPECNILRNVLDNKK